MGNDYATEREDTEAVLDERAIRLIRVAVRCIPDDYERPLSSTYVSRLAPP